MFMNHMTPFHHFITKTRWTKPEMCAHAHVPIVLFKIIRIRCFVLADANTLQITFTRSKLIDAKIKKSVSTKTSAHSVMQLSP